MLHRSTQDVLLVDRQDEGLYWEKKLNSKRCRLKISFSNSVKNVAFHGRSQVFIQSNLESRGMMIFFFFTENPRQ